MDQLKDLVQLMAAPQHEVKQLALEALLPYTPKTAGKTFLFKDNNFAGIKAIQEMVGNADLERNALSALVNLTDDKDIRDVIVQNTPFVNKIVDNLLSPGEKHPGLLAMLLTNLSHSEDIKSIIGKPLLYLGAKFAKETGPEYDYLAYVFASIARTTEGADFWTGKNKETIPLAKLYPQILFSSEIRRSGVAATMKNAIFDLGCHERVVETGIIEYIMIALKGPEEMDERDAAELPDIVKENFGSDKKREEDPHQQLVLLETLLILSSSKIGRKALRDRNAYYVVRELHLASKDEEVVSAAEKFVNMVMRGEPEEAKVTEVTPEEDEEDEGITEVV